MIRGRPAFRRIGSGATRGNDLARTESGHGTRMGQQTGQITFLLNGDPVIANDISATTTLLDWLREGRGLKGTKEGCNEGDCGACSVIVTDAAGAKALNACILLLPQLDGKAVRIFDIFTITTAMKDILWLNSSQEFD